MQTEKRDFDAEAATWDEEPRRVRLAGDLFRAINGAALCSPAMDALDFGCGTGLVTLQLAACVRSVTAVDSSRGMLEVLARKARASAAENVRVRHLDLDAGDTVEGAHDLIVSTMTLHHVRDVERLLGQFYRALRPGGRLCLADLDLEDGAFHGNNDGVFHLGFDRDQLTRWLEAAGFSQVEITTAAEVVKPVADGNLRAFPIFLATAVR